MQIKVMGGFLDGIDFIDYYRQMDKMDGMDFIDGIDIYRRDGLSQHYSTGMLTTFNATFSICGWKMVILHTILKSASY